MTTVPPPPPADGSPVTTALIILFLVLGVPFGFWMMWSALTFDNHPDFGRDL